MTPRPVRDFHKARSGLSMLEVLVSSLLVGVVLVAAMNSVGATIRGRRFIGDAQQGLLLAQQLASEIQTYRYAEPVDPPVFGTESGEGGGTRAGFDDVDDLAGWDASPPAGRDGAALTSLSGWRRVVTVEYLDPDDLTQVVGSDLGIKQATITVFHNGTEVASLAVVRARAWDP